MSKKIITLAPTGTKKPQFIIERNNRLAKYLGDITEWPYIGDCKQHKDLLADEAFFFPHNPIPPWKAEQLVISNEGEFYGSVAPILHTNMNTVFVVIHIVGFTLNSY